MKIKLKIQSLFTKAPKKFKNSKYFSQQAFMCKIFYIFEKEIFLRIRGSKIFLKVKITLILKAHYHLKSFSLPTRVAGTALGLSSISEICMHVLFAHDTIKK